MHCVNLFFSFIHLIVEELGRTLEYSIVHILVSIL